VAAANLRLKQGGGKALIITLKSVQKQWAQEIIKFVGGNKDEISFDGTNPKKWTILYYENFQSGKNKDVVIETTRKTDYTIVAFDEVHKIKHQTAKRSKNLHDATSHIPYKWGASATMAANKPFDIKNQLRMLGHRMGDVSDGWFKREFAGMVPEGYGGSYVEGGRDKQIESAIQFRKWLADSGIYIRRSKKEIRSDMPSLERDTVDIILSDNELGGFYKIMDEKLKNAKDPDMALTKLLAARQAVAHQKVPYTVKRAREIVENGEKLVIFTSFIEPGRELVKQLTRELRRINADYKVGVYTSDSKDRFAEKERFMKDPMVKALVMSIKIGGTGVDFPNGVNHMIVNDFDWTPEQAEQSEGRIFRINSMDNKVVEYIIVGNTIDAEIFDMVSKKREISEILQTDLTQAHQNPEDRKTAGEIYDAMVKIQDIDKKLVDMGRKVGSNRPQI
jgi:SNF2 family DNA or RNA helicase